MDCSQVGEGYEYMAPRLSGGTPVRIEPECYPLWGQGPYVCVALPINEQNLFVVIVNGILAANIIYLPTFLLSAIV